MFRLSALILLALPLWPQSSVTVTAGRTNPSKPDLVVFAVDLATGLDVGRDEVLAAAPGSLLTAARLSDVRTVESYTETGATSSLAWTFTVTAPLANFKATVTQLSELQKTIAGKKNGMSLSFSIRGTAASDQATQSVACSNTELLADARAQAQKIATAAGAQLGAVLAMAGSSATVDGRPSYSYPCALTVKFALGGL